MTEPAVLITVGLLAAFGALALLLSTVGAAVAQKRNVYRSLRSMPAGQVAGEQYHDSELAVPVMRRVVLPGLSRVSKRVLAFSPPSIVDRLEQDLTYAGRPAGWDGSRLLALKYLLAVITAIATVVALPLLTELGVLRTAVLAVFAAFIGYYAPEWVVRSIASDRQKQIRLQLPDSLDLMSITVEAGLGFDAAMERVSREMGGPLGEEYTRVVQEMRLGKSRSEAMRDLAERTTVDELRSFVLAMVQAEVFGISVAHVLHVQADELRTKRRQMAEEQAQKLPVKILFPLIFCILPALFVVLLGPAAIQIYENIILN